MDREVLVRACFALSMLDGVLLLKKQVVILNSQKWRPSITSF